MTTDRVAQWIARWTSDPAVAGSSPVTVVISLFVFYFLVFYFFIFLSPTIVNFLTVAQLEERGTVSLVVIPRSLVRVRPVRFLVGWPSGLRRQVKALVSSEAWVQIPLQPYKAHLAQTVERWPFKPMVVGSIPTVGGGIIYFFCFVCQKRAWSSWLWRLPNTQ